MVIPEDRITWQHERPKAETKTMFGLTLTVNLKLDSETQAELNDIAWAVERAATALEEIAFWSRPRLAVGPVSVHSKGQSNMAQFSYTFNLPVPANPDDVATRQLAVATNGGEAVLTPVDKTATVSPAFLFNDGDAFSIHVVDADAAGNMSFGPLLTVAVVDDVPPATPGELAVASKTQV